VNAVVVKDRREKERSRKVADEEYIMWCLVCIDFLSDSVYFTSCVVMGEK